MTGLLNSMVALSPTQQFSNEALPRCEIRFGSNRAVQPPSTAAVTCKCKPTSLTTTTTTTTLANQNCSL
jgi:hypothetical protein